MEDASRLFGTGFTYFCDLLAIELRNVEALGLAQQKMLEGIGVLAQRQAEIVDGTVRRAFEAKGSSNGSAIARVIDQIGSLKTAMRRGRRTRTSCRSSRPAMAARSRASCSRA